MQYLVRNRRRLRPATRDLVPATHAAPAAPVVGAQPGPRAEGSGLLRRPLVTEINLTIPGRDR